MCRWDGAYVTTYATSPKATAKTIKGRPQLEKAIDALGTGDVLVIAEWDRATRSMKGGITFIRRVADRGSERVGQTLARSYNTDGQGHFRLSVRVGRG